MGVGMCLYAQLVQMKNKQCKSAIILQCYHRICVTSAPHHGQVNLIIIILVLPKFI